MKTLLLSSLIFIFTQLSSCEYYTNFVFPDNTELNSLLEKSHSIDILNIG